MHPANIEISLHTRKSYQSLLESVCIANNPRLLQADSEGSVQTAQPDPSLHWTHMSKGTYSCDPAHFLSLFLEPWYNFHSIREIIP